eukprot:scaffold47750_cov54-Attheya_sp.AAC.4
MDTSRVHCRRPWKILASLQLYLQPDDDVSRLPAIFGLLASFRSSTTWKPVESYESSTMMKGNLGTLSSDRFVLLRGYL